MIRSSLARLGRGVNVWLTRGPASLRRLGIPESPVDPARRGLVIIGIDGLGYGRLLKALRRRQLPFLRRMLTRRQMNLHRYRSEIPTSTPAFQAGLFYGNNDNIPGFQFYNKREQRLYRMGDSECAYDIERRLGDSGILRQGSVFTSVYTGGADAGLFVFSTLLAPKRWRFALRVWDIVLLSFINVVLILRILLLALLELILGLWDFAVGFLTRGMVRRELEFVALRVGVTIICREISTLGAIIDIYRGVPSIYLNFLGYDEHSHLRGPDSGVACWTLRGIDRCINRIYRATLFAERRYDVFVMSDHGQCATLPFEYVTGETLGEYLQTELTDMLVDAHVIGHRRNTEIVHSIEGLHRLAPSMPRAFRGLMRAYARFLRRRLDLAAEGFDIEASLDINVVSSGPVAYVYWTRVPEPLTMEQIEHEHPGLVARLARHCSIGFVSVRSADGGVIVRSGSGEAVFARGKWRCRGHLPFDGSTNRRHILDGVRRVTLFPLSGDICVWGGGSPSGNVSYTWEFGAHSGWTDDEVNAFVLAPASVDFAFSTITRHGQFYEFFRSYGDKAAADQVAGDTTRRSEHADPG